MRSPPFQGIFVVKMLFELLPCLLVHRNTHTRLVFQTPQSTIQGGDVILPAAAPGVEAKKGESELE